MLGLEEMMSLRFLVVMGCSSTSSPLPAGLRVRHPMEIVAQSLESGAVNGR